jgi:hypothetical protein
MKDSQAKREALIWSRLSDVLASIENDEPSEAGRGHALQQIARAREVLTRYLAHARLLEAAIDFTASKVADRLPGGKS